jgi:hypothetical protein
VRWNKAARPTGCAIPADILKGVEIEQDHFAANAETGLKPLLSGYDIQEVPISWINRTVEMGHSTFCIVNVAFRQRKAMARARQTTAHQTRAAPFRTSYPHPNDR